jgi:hypothetical protein
VGKRWVHRLCNPSSAGDAADPRWDWPNYERFAAYAVASAFLVLAYPRRPIRVGILVIAIAVVLEIAQLAIPDRDARVIDTLVKVAGGLAGIAAAAFWNRRDLQAGVSRP